MRHQPTARQRARSDQIDAAPRTPSVSSHDRLLRALASPSTGTNHTEGPKSCTNAQDGYQPSADSSREHPAAAAWRAEHQVKAAGGAAPQLAQRCPAHERPAARCQRTSRAQYLRRRRVTRALVDKFCTTRAERIMTAKVRLTSNEAPVRGIQLLWGGVDV